MPIDSSLLPQFFQVTLAVNATIEVAAFTILVPPIVTALNRAGYGRKRIANKTAVRLAEDTDGAGKDIISNSAESESANGGDRERKDAKDR